MRKPTRSERAQASQDDALDDFQHGQIANEFYAKTVDRGIADRDVERVLRSQSSGVWEYEYEGQPRLGFWHPALHLFVAWRPAAGGVPSEIKTCFPERDGSRYMARRDRVTALRRPKE